MAAGEFAPARREAAGQSDPARRDALFVQIATAQRAVGDRAGYLLTLAMVGDDRVRSSLVQTAPEAPLPLVTTGNFGGSQADFDSLINLMVTTIAPDSWEDVGGPGSVQPFPNGVYVDAEGVLRRSVPAASTDLAGVRAAAVSANRQGADPRRRSALRKVSLPRLERHVQLLAAAGRRPDETAALLAGISQVEYLFVCPETGDLILAGPAGDWRTDAEGRIVSAESGRPVLRLDDLVVLLRHFTLGDGSPIGCSIEPEQAGLARLQEFVERSRQRSLRPGERKAWTRGLRAALGRQRIEVFGIDPTTRVAQVLIEADYRMKLVGMGLEPGTHEVPSYLELIEIPRGGAPPPMSVLRWWFALAERGPAATPERDGWVFSRGSARVLSENELLAALGQRVHTGKSDPLNQEFARNFTADFADLAIKYPVYAELENVFDLALVAAAIKAHDLAPKVGWNLSGFGDATQYRVPRREPPRSVESVVNHRAIGRGHVVAGVSGGVSLDPRERVLAAALRVQNYGTLAAERAAAARAAPQSADRWWWD